MRFVTRICASRSLNSSPITASYSRQYASAIIPARGTAGFWGCGAQIGKFLVKCRPRMRGCRTQFARQSQHGGRPRRLRTRGALRSGLGRNVIANPPALHLQGNGEGPLRRPRNPANHEHATVRESATGSPCGVCRRQVEHSWGGQIRQRANRGGQIRLRAHGCGLIR